MDHYVLIRLYGLLEPKIVVNDIPHTEDALEKAIINHMKEEPYGDEYDDDCLIIIDVVNGRIVKTFTYSGGYMGELREKAELLTVQP